MVEAVKLVLHIIFFTFQCTVDIQKYRQILFRAISSVGFY